MKNILLRSSMHPLQVYSTGDAIKQNIMNQNTGNMIFAHSVARTLLLDDTSFGITRTVNNFSNEAVEKINAEYDCFVIPLANAFRVSFQSELDIMTSLIKRLKIPCVVVGIGLQAKVDEALDKDFEFDDSARRFIKAVLEKSAIIGVRGEITAEYMKHLGFTEEKDFTVIGCPSMYLYGDQVPLKEIKELTPQSKVSVNRKIGIPGALHQFIYDSSQKFEDAVFIPQGIDDLRLLYAGKSIDRQKFPSIHKTYPWQMDNPICSSGHEIAFTNVPSWLDYLSKREFSFGSRIHGNIAAVLAGTPAYIFAPDSRILELARYHNIQHMAAKDIKKDTNIFDVYEKADFTSVQRGHKQRFEHYLDFLEANGLEHVYKEDRVNHRTRFDDMIESMDFPSGVMALNLQDLTEQRKRLDDYFEYLMKRYGSSDSLEKYVKLDETVRKYLDKVPSGVRKTMVKGIKKLIK